MRPTLAALAAAVIALLLGAPALAQFDVPAGTSIRERIAGQLLSAEGAPAPEPGDQLAAFFDGTVVGVFSYTDEDTTRAFELLIFGDNPGTPGIVEGPSRGDRVEIRFFDSSANQIRTDVVVENPNGERFNYRYAGEEVPPILDDLPIPIDLTPTQNLNFRVGVAAGGGGGGGDDDDPAGDYDVNGDGEINTRDAALVLRIVSGASRGVGSDTIARADVNNDNVVNTADAIAILQNR